MITMGVCGDLRFALMDESRGEVKYNSGVLVGM